MKEYKVEEHIKDFSSEAPSHEEVKNLAALAADDRERLLRAGIDEEQKAAGTFVHADHSTVYCNSNLKGVEIAPISYALFKHDGLRDYYWKIMDRERDAFT